jgi:hypothetical protein
MKSGKAGEPLAFDDSCSPPLDVRVADVNQHAHLTNINRHVGSLSSAAHDPSQTDIRAFFGGTQVGKGKVEALEHAQSNVEDQPGKVLDEGNSKM